MVTTPTSARTEGRSNRRARGQAAATNSTWWAASSALAARQRGSPAVRLLSIRCCSDNRPDQKHGRANDTTPVISSPRGGPPGNLLESHRPPQPTKRPDGRLGSPARPRGEPHEVRAIIIAVGLAGPCVGSVRHGVRAGPEQGQANPSPHQDTHTVRDPSGDRVHRHDDHCMSTRDGNEARRNPD